MQTFMPLPGLRASARALDPLRLGKQRLEGLQILEILSGVRWDPLVERYNLEKREGYASHPAVRMWRGFDAFLVKYVREIIREHVSRGGDDRLSPRLERWFGALAPADLPVPKPRWFGDEAFHANHRAVLLAKDPAWYSWQGWEDEPATRDPATGRWPYVWPESGYVEPV